MKKLRHFVIRYLTKHLLKAISEDDILTIVGKEWFYKKRKLTREEMLILKEEAASFEKSLLYELMYRDLRYLASRMMNEDAQTVDDITFGKAMLYNGAMEKKFVRNIANVKL